MKIISWNIDSLNAGLTGNSERSEQTRVVLDRIASEKADIIAFQETKLPYKGPTTKHLALLAERFPDYQLAFRHSEPPARPSYAGTMFLYAKGLEPAITMPTISAPDTMDAEGRILTLEFPDYYVTQVYTPNAGTELKRLPDRQVWDECYGEYLSTLAQKKGVIACGDFNVAHEEIDLANPAANHFSAGFTDQEREGFTKLLARGFVDAYRSLYRDVTGVYTWWAQRVTTSKINNSGWRIDYFVLSDSLKKAAIRMEVMDSGPRRDHAPILLEI